MKLIFISLLLMVIAMSAITVIDRQREQALYSFCTSFSVGNKISEIELKVETSDFSSEIPDEQTLLIINPSILPLDHRFICEIKHQKGKITQLNFSN